MDPVILITCRWLSSTFNWVDTAPVTLSRRGCLDPLWLAVDLTQCQSLSRRGCVVSSTYNWVDTVSLFSRRGCLDPLWLAVDLTQCQSLSRRGCVVSSTYNWLDRVPITVSPWMPWSLMTGRWPLTLLDIQLGWHSVSYSLAVDIPYDRPLTWPSASHSLAVDALSPRPTTELTECRLLSHHGCLDPLWPAVDRWLSSTFNWLLGRRPRHFNSRACHRERGAAYLTVTYLINLIDRQLDGETGTFTPSRLGP